MTSSHPSPPHALESPLEVDPSDWEPREVYRLMTGLVIPRPIAWVSTLSADGTRNVAPHSYFNVVANNPPHVAFSSTGEKDTLRNVRATGEFVVNLVTHDLVEPMNLTSADFPPEEDEFSWAGLTEAPGARVGVPRVAEARAHLECRLVQVVPIGNGNLIIGEVVHVHVDPALWHDGRVDPVRYDPVCRLSGSSYATLGEVFQLARPSWEELQGDRPGSKSSRERG